MPRSRNHPRAVEVIIRSTFLGPNPGHPACAQRLLAFAKAHTIYYFLTSVERRPDHARDQKTVGIDPSDAAGNGEEFSGMAVSGERPRNAVKVLTCRIVVARLFRRSGQGPRGMRANQARAGLRAA